MTQFYALELHPGKRSRLLGVFASEGDANLAIDRAGGPSAAHGVKTPASIQTDLLDAMQDPDLDVPHVRILRAARIALFSRDPLRRIVYRVVLSMWWRGVLRLSTGDFRLYPAESPCNGDAA